MRRLDRYILREIFGLLVLGFIVYTFILLLQYLFSSAEMIIQRGLPAATVGRLLLLVLPSSVVLTIPMALLFAILIAIGRLAGDSELVALRASGISLLSLYRPILLLSLGLFLLNSFLTLEVMPAGNYALQQLNLEIFAQSVSQQVQPRVFHEEWEGRVLYVFEIPPGQNRWKGVFLADSRQRPEGATVTVADWGEIRLADEGESLILELENAEIHEVDLHSPDSYRVSRHKRLEIVLEDEFTSSQRVKISTSKSIRTMDLDDLRDVLRDPEASSEMQNLARVQIHKSLAIPCACLVFGLLALPLGFNNRRGGKTAGFALSIGIIMLYWVMLSNGENAARFGKTEPWLAMWLPNLLMAFAGIFLLVRRNRDKSLLLSRVDRWVREDLWRGILVVASWFKRRGQAVKEKRRTVKQARLQHSRLVLRLPRLSWRISNLLDRYVVRRFLGVFGLVLASVVVLYIVGDIGENIDDMLKNNVPRSVVVDYYKYLTLQILYDVSPIVVLVTTLLTFSILARANELTAFKALGVSLFRLALPAIGVTVLVVLGNVYLQSEILPVSNQKVAQLKNQIKGREVARTYRRADRQWLFGQGRYVYNYLRYDNARQSLERLQVFEFDDNYHLSRRLFTARATYQEEGFWIFDPGWIRSFGGAPQQANFETFSEPLLIDYPETPDYFTSEIRPPEQMRYFELRDYIEELEGRGEAVPELRVELQKKLSYPSISLVMVLVALPFAFRIGRQGALFGIGLSVVLGMVFMAVFILFSTLGTAGILPPAIAVWSPNLIFAMLALYLFLGVRT